MLHCHPSYGGICSGACPNNLKFELGTVIPSLGGASFARHGVHDVHRAHYLNLSAAIQDVDGQTLTRKLQADNVHLRNLLTAQASVIDNLQTKLHEIEARLIELE